MSIFLDEKIIYNLQLKRIGQVNKRLAGIFENTRDNITAELLKYKASVLKGGVIQPQKEERLQRLLDSVSKELISLTGKSKKLINKEFINTYESTYYNQLWAYEKSVNLDLGLNASYSLKIPAIRTEVIQAAFDERIGGLLLQDRINRVRIGTQYLVQEAIAQNLITGESVKKLSKKLKLIDEAMQVGFKNTERIARTELLRAYSLGQDQSRVQAENSGVEFNYIWSATLDSKVRPDHARMDQKEAIIVDGDPVFNVNGVKMSAPRIPVIQTGSKAEARQVINCRCRRLNIPFGIKPATRVAKTKEGRWKTVNGDLTAEEWIKKEYDIKLK